MDFDFSGMGVEAAKAKCRRMFANIPIGEPIINSSLVAFLANDPGLGERRATLKGDVKYYRRINPRHGGTAFYLVGDGGATTYASWPCALLVVMGRMPKAIPAWYRVYQRIYALVKNEIYANSQEGLLLHIPIGDMITEWMKSNGYTREDLTWATDEAISAFSGYFDEHAMFMSPPKKFRRN
jgi:hypothetical protein